MLINLSNHPYSTWSEDQKTAAIEKFGTVLDFPFPVVNPVWGIEEVSGLADECMEQLFQIADKNSQVNVHLAGEFTLVYQILERLKLSGFDAVIATSERMTLEQPDGSKVVRFRFVRFRSYFD
ncbi:MAG: hypothetical protein AMXMBFR48_14530 [Ignavibacteriales bacterium]